ncbi:HAMP domain-containing sensor histidine kinase [Brevundimonas sp. SORGH_AS_0993]|uniref:sensor histidine kinase n=1 Tax=Brevundimonas sp. SORGH_AS_0993 TaxID=3041794 RepID=UPI002780537B|nr:ATP-binding protein [Brevundimonas sp. SORGH_AS_0993]MDQ1154772.1 signal transduction histidine kinase [Brevundimonas sp. SORGH_AS_0993]
MLPDDYVQRPLLHRLIATGDLRYWLIASWALALLTTTDLVIAGVWFLVATVVGVGRGYLDRRSTPKIRLIVATLSCACWAAAPILSFRSGSVYGAALAVALLMAGYVLVFTQMRAAPREALIVSAPYSAASVWLLVQEWGSPGFWVLLAVTPVLGLALLIKVTITQMKDAELVAVNHRQADLIAELEIARDRADAANAAKSNFLGVISHELRTPMNGVLGAAHLLRMTDLNARQSSFVDIITQSGDGLLVLLNDILDLTKIEAGRMDLAPALVETEGLMERLIGPFGAQAEAKGLRFTAEQRGDWPALACLDPLRLAQISNNLLGNAVKFTAAGEVRFVMEGERRPDGRLALRIDIGDSGIGIAPEDQARLFQPFTQIDDSSTRRFGGTGLGLSICHRLAVLMGGQITVRSEVGRGSVFTIAVVVDAPEWAADPAPSGAA